MIFGDQKTVVVFDNYTLYAHNNDHSLPTSTKAETETLEQYRLVDSEYALVATFQKGVIECSVIPGFNIPVRALFDQTEQVKTLAGM